MFQVDAEGVFESAFVVHLAAITVIREYGRPVCSTDMGHFKHDLFDGINCTGTLGISECAHCIVHLHLLINTRLLQYVLPHSLPIYCAYYLGLFQMGSGTLLPVWTAVFASRAETKEMWGDCADVLIEAGVADVYANAVHFRDRHVGATYFEVCPSIL